ncbi:tetratricopeptide repeat protein [Candidatus Leptofilum sp.]|uniref:tetratricopeptide repeat protein n=1 Tax=Candidatus Leptofilum sp. TaxID=3241576 RepID=UPI003B5C5D7D
MSKQYPEYVLRLLAQARSLLQEDDYGQMDAAALCFEVLADYPELDEAADLVLEAFSDPWLIRDNRKAIGRHVDEWDDRPWQQRRRLALSFRYTSRWEGRHQQYDEFVDMDDVMPADVRDMLDEGRGQLLQDYLLGQSRGSEMAWPIFLEAFKRTAKPQAAMLWVGLLYAEQGYFAEAVDVLEMLLAQFPNSQDGRRLWAEVRWWRNYQDRIPWIPPRTSSHGRRYRQMMSQIDPELAAEPDVSDEPFEHIPPNVDNLPDDFAMPKPAQVDLIARVDEVLAGLPEERGWETAVDWSYLDKLESGDIDTSQFPEWAQYLLLEIDDPQQELFLKQYLLSYLSNPPLFDDSDEEDLDFLSDSST